MKISIVTAAWQSADTICDTMESVLRQTHQDFEHIIVDGASTDDTLKVLSEYAPRYNGRLRVVSEPDKGIYDAMNKGIRMATGEVVGILNSDDFFTSDNILERVAAEIGDADAVYGDIHYVDAEATDRCVRYYSSKNFKRSHMRMGFMPAHPSFYCRRSVYDNFGLYDTSFRIAADFEMLLRLIYLNRISTRYLGADFVTMRTGGASTSGLRSHRLILREHMKAYRKNGINSNYLFEGCRYAYRIWEVWIRRRK